jgi:Type I phosphodiesterase / nucleotide pyrophosphatase
VTGAPLAVRTRSGGSIDSYAVSVGRWLVTRDGFDFFLYYLPDYDYASHTEGPERAHAALARTDRAVGALLDAAGGPDEFLERYSVLVCSDHGQTSVERAVRLEDALAGFSLFSRSNRAAELAVTASNRAGMVYRLPACRAESSELADVLEAEASVEVVLYREGDQAVACRGGEELRFTRDNGAFSVRGDEAVLPYPDALERAWSALANPNAGDLIVAAAPGFEFADLGGRHHAGGGSHGSLDAGDSEVPMLAVGLEPPSSITEVAPAVLRHFGVRPPASMREAVRAA